MNGIRKLNRDVSEERGGAGHRAVFLVVPSGNKHVQTFRVEVEIKTTAARPLLLRWDHQSDDRLAVNRLNFYDWPMEAGSICEFEVGTYGHTPTFGVKQSERDIPFTTLKSTGGHGMIRVTYPRAGTFRLLVGGLKEGEFTTYKMSTWSAVPLKRD